MSHVALAKTEEIERNLAKFVELLPDLIQGHKGQCALMHHSEIIDFYPSAIEAQIAGNQRFIDGIFSIQHVQETPEELGRYSYALPPRAPL